ncbi:hypothetical protein Syun_002205 [Stephania yunnanensis]|uniref:3-oxoacyl-[acyl-carrier-protein] reductase n=1 Tax=Stephania yunnanensis TaxID=152371 RepID=A0AAP0Q777_9MAGN
MDSKCEERSVDPWRRLDGKVVMVTGASSGIGYELCLDLARAGCKVVAAARRIDRLRSLCEEIGRLSGGGGVRAAAAVELDVSANGGAIEASVRKAWDAFGRIDALVNNAGIRGKYKGKDEIFISALWFLGTVKSPLELSEEEWDSNFATNLKGSWLVSKYVCIRMRDAGLKGSVVNISSIAGLHRGQLPGGVAYAASKAGINAVTKVMAIELGAYKIRVNSISPGLFKSEITEGLMSKEWLQNVALRTVPLRAYGKVDPALTTLISNIKLNLEVEEVLRILIVTVKRSELIDTPVAVWRRWQGHSEA